MEKEFANYSGKGIKKNLEKSTSALNRVSERLEDNVDYINKKLTNAMGLNVSKNIIFKGRKKAVFVFIESMTDKEVLGYQVVKPLIEFDGKVKADMAKFISEGVIFVPNSFLRTNFDDIISDILFGMTAIFIEGEDTAVTVRTRKIIKQAITKPEKEVDIFGTKEAFTDDININISMVTDRVASDKLQFEDFKAGKVSNTMIKLLWIKGVTDEKTVEEARRRINNIDIDIVSGAGNLSEMIQDNVLRIFPTFMITERPDKVARHLCDGQFAILVNNSPAAFVAPISIVDFFKTIDDYAERSVLGSFMRVIRYISVFIATSISALYTSFVTYNQNIMPPALAFSIAKGREDVPFPTIVELLLMTFIIDIIREGGVRMPGAVGFTLGIIGAVVISDAAVSAGIISPSLIIVIAMSALASFAVPAPQLSNTVRVINYSFIVLSGLFGITGYITGVLVLLLFLVSQKSFGVPYLYPLVPFERAGVKDSVIRMPLRNLKMRLKKYAPFNRRRMR